MNLTDHSEQAYEEVIVNNEATNHHSNESSTVSPSPILRRINNYSNPTLEPNIINLSEQPCSSDNDPKEPKATPPKRDKPGPKLQEKISQLRGRTPLPRPAKNSSPKKKNQQSKGTPTLHL